MASYLPPMPLAPFANYSSCIFVSDSDSMSLVRCRFNNVRVPLDGLLDKYASVSPEGAYSSPIPTVAARFGTMVLLTTSADWIGQSN